jgi:hypothetical protein
MTASTARARINGRIAALNQEMDEIHYANSLYWNHGLQHTKEANAQYQFRQERLEKIRTELAQLREEALRAGGRA